MDENQNEIVVPDSKIMQDAVRADMQDYLNSIHPEPDDPSIILSWNWSGLHRFVATANVTIGPQSNVRIRNIGFITPVSLAEDIVTHIKLTAQNRCRQLFANADVLFAPNNPTQFGQLVAQMSKFAYDPFIQAVIRLNPHPIKFGRLSILLDKQTLTNAIDFDLSIGDPFCPFSI